MTRRAQIFLTLALAAAAAPGCSRGEAAGDGDSAAARRGTLVVWVAARGKVAAESNVVITPPRWWGLKIGRLAVKEGDVVQKGDILMELETENLEDRIRDVTRDIRSAEGALDSARANLRGETERLQSGVARATEDLAKARRALDELRKQPLPTDLRNAEIDRDTRSKAADQARVRYDTMKVLHAAGGASLKQLGEKEMDFRAAEADARRADLLWQVVKAGPTPAAVRDAEITVALADLALAQAERDRDLTLEQIEESVKKAEGWVNMCRQTLLRIQRVQEQCTVRAPVAGMVYYSEVWTNEGQQKIKEGMEVHPWDRIMELPDTSRLRIRVDVEESDVGKVVVGQTARITLDAWRDKRFAGKVTEIDRVTQRRGGRETGRTGVDREDVGAKVVAVVVTFDETDPLVRNGLSGRAEVRTGEEAEGVLVPLKAVFSLDGRDVVYRVVDGRPVATPVTVGGRSDADALILSGLQEGERVTLTAPGGRTEEKPAPGGAR